MKLNEEKQKNIRLMGFVFLLLAIGFTAYSFFAPSPLPENSSIFALTSNQKETFFMGSLVFAFAGIFCLGSVRSEPN